MKRLKYPKTIVYHRDDIIVGYRENTREPMKTKLWEEISNDLGAQTYGYTITSYSAQYLDLYIGIDYKAIL